MLAFCSLVLKDFLASGFLQGGELQGGILVLGRHAGVAVFHTLISLLRLPHSARTLPLNIHGSKVLTCIEGVECTARTTLESNNLLARISSSVDSGRVGHGTGQGSAASGGSGVAPFGNTPHK